MRKHICISLFLVFMLFMSPVVHAASATKIGVPIKITTNGTETTGQISFTSEDSSAPMPNENPVTINGKDNVVLSYSKTGTTKYTIKQVAGSDSDTTYDTTVYHLTVFIGYKDGGLYSVVTLYKDGSSDKDSEAVFANTKKVADETTPSTSADEGTTTTPDTSTSTTDKKKTTTKKKKTTSTSKKSSSSSENGSGNNNRNKTGNSSDSATNGSENDGSHVNGSKSGNSNDSATSGNENGKSRTGTNGVKTSDPTIIIPYAVAAIVSFMILIVLLIRTLKKKH